MNGKFSSRRGEGVKSGNGDKERIMGMQVWGRETRTQSSLRIQVITVINYFLPFTDN